MHGRSKTAGSTVVEYEVQPPEGTQWFGDKAEVDAMVELLWAGDYELDDSFGTSQVTAVTNPVTVLYTSVPSDNNDDNLMLVIALFASALVVMVGVAVVTVLYYRRRALRRSFNNRTAAAVNEVESLDERETRALYAVRHTCKTARPTCWCRALRALSLSVSLCLSLSLPFSARPETIGHHTEPFSDGLQGGTGADKAESVGSAWVGGWGSAVAHNQQQ
jgi:hypothetical protein